MKRNFGLILAISALAMLLLSSGPVFAYTVEGDFNTPGTYTLSTGGDLWTLLQATGGGLFTAGVENTYEGDFVLVTGRNGSSALYAVGELDTKFAPAGAVTLTLDKNRQCDLAGEGRAVKDVSNIDVLFAVPVIKGGQYFFSNRLVVSGAGIIPKTYYLADIEKMTQEIYTNTSGATWTGPTLLSLLKASGVNTRDMNSYVVVSATDGYATVLSMYEVTHMTGTQYDLLAITASDGELNEGPWVNSKGTQNDDGFARLVVPGDKGAGRWVSNVDQIVVHRLPRVEGCWSQR